MPVLKKAELLGHDVTELAAGRLPRCWGERSLYLTDDVLLWLAPFLDAVLPRRNPFGPTVVYERDWDAICRRFEACPPAISEHRATFSQLDSFVRNALFTCAAVTFYGE